VSDGYLQSTYQSGHDDVRGPRVLRRRDLSGGVEDAATGMYDRVPHLNDGKPRSRRVGAVLVLVGIVAGLWFSVHPYLNELLSVSP
jgi:hypothetical protein